MLMRLERLERRRRRPADAGRGKMQGTTKGWNREILVVVGLVEVDQRVVVVVVVPLVEAVVAEAVLKHRRTTRKAPPSRIPSLTATAAEGTASGTWDTCSTEGRGGCRS